MNGTLYTFASGFTYWTIGKLNATEKKKFIAKYGKIISEKKC